MVNIFISSVLIIGTAIAGVCFDVDIYNYQGAVVVDYGNPMFQLNGFIWGGVSEHEYGHYIQQGIYGDVKYYAKVAIPSIVATGWYAVKKLIGYKNDARIYLALPWESEATNLGLGTKP